VISQGHRVVANHVVGAYVRFRAEHVGDRLARVHVAGVKQKNVRVLGLYLTYERGDLRDSTLPVIHRIDGPVVVVGMKKDEFVNLSFFPFNRRGYACACPKQYCPGHYRRKKRRDFFPKTFSHD
jgi:hypothetical protein